MIWKGSINTSCVAGTIVYIAEDGRFEFSLVGVFGSNNEFWFPVCVVYECVGLRGEVDHVDIEVHGVNVQWVTVDVDVQWVTVDVH